MTKEERIALATMIRLGAPVYAAWASTRFSTHLNLFVGGKYAGSVNMYDTRVMVLSEDPKCGYGSWVASSRSPAVVGLLKFLERDEPWPKLDANTPR